VLWTVFLLGLIVLAVVVEAALRRQFLVEGIETRRRTNASWANVEQISPEPTGVRRTGRWKLQKR
jgi:hypothetical protein